MPPSLRHPRAEKGAAIGVIAAPDDSESEVHAFRAETTGRFETIHRDLEELRGEWAAEHDRVRSLIERGFAAVTVALVIGFAAVVAAIALFS